MLIGKLSGTRQRENGLTEAAATSAFPPPSALLFSRGSLRPTMKSLNIFFRSIAAAVLLSSLPTNGCAQEADFKAISEEISSSSRKLSAEEVFSRCEPSVLRVEVDLKEGGRRT